MKGGKIMHLASCVLAASLLLSACGSLASGEAVSLSAQRWQSVSDTLERQPAPVQTGFITEQILNGAQGEIHYSYYLPKDYDVGGAYPLMMVMPGYDMMWFGQQSSGSNLSWTGFRARTELEEDMIVVSAQLTDWGDKSARQAIELTEYFIENFAVDESRVYAAGYSAGGETMSRAVSMRPDLYAAYLHGASQWDGTFTTIAENRVAVYIFMAENDEYYGSRRARDAYDSLYGAYREAGVSDEEINQLLQVEIPDNEWFAQRGVRSNYHGGGNVLFDEKRILDWIISARKPESSDSQTTAFSDMEANAWYAGTVKYVRDNGLMSGTSDMTFSPNASTSRAMLATILYRASGSPAVTQGADFSDVAPDAYYADAGQDYADESAIADYAAETVDWARTNGIMSGTDGSRFDPKGNATRAQVAVILRSFCESVGQAAKAGQE